MVQIEKSRVDMLTDGQSWMFANDIRLVGELTKVVQKITTGVILEGWATITAYGSAMTEGAIPGMCVVGPVFRTAKRAEILDWRPIFCRIESMIPSVVRSSQIGVA